MSNSSPEKAAVANRAPIPMNQCGMAQAADLIGDRWTLLIIREALYGVTRFDAIQADISAPRTVLSSRLKNLCDAGVMTKRPYKEPGQRRRMQYVLTSKGIDLALPLIALMQWGDKHLLKTPAAAAMVERKSGAPLSAGLVSDKGEPVDLRDAQFRINS